VRLLCVVCVYVTAFRRAVTRPNCETEEEARDQQRAVVPMMYICMYSRKKFFTYKELDYLQTH
jgi:hypothetical protein